MWTYVAGGCTLFLALTGAICKSSRRTVDPGCHASKCRFGRPIMTRVMVEGKPVLALKDYEPGQIIWIIPGIHILRQVRVFEARTHGETQPIRVPDKKTYNLRPVLVYNVSLTTGLEMALTKLTPELYLEQVDNFFANVVVRVVEERGIDPGHDELIEALKAAATVDKNLSDYGVLPQRVILRERAGTQVTQFFEQATPDLLKVVTDLVGVPDPRQPESSEQSGDNGERVVLPFHEPAAASG